MLNGANQGLVGARLILRIRVTIIPTKAVAPPVTPLIADANNGPAR